MTQDTTTGLEAANRFRAEHPGVFCFPAGTRKYPKGPMFSAFAEGESWQTEAAKPERIEHPLFGFTAQAWSKTAAYGVVHPAGDVLTVDYDSPHPHLTALFTRYLTWNAATARKGRRRYLYRIDPIDKPTRPQLPHAAGEVWSGVLGYYIGPGSRLLDGGFYQIPAAPPALVEAPAEVRAWLTDDPQLCPECGYEWLDDDPVFKPPPGGKANGGRPAKRRFKVPVKPGARQDYLVRRSAQLAHRGFDLAGGVRELERVVKTELLDAPPPARDRFTEFNNRRLVKLMETAIHKFGPGGTERVEKAARRDRVFLPDEQSPVDIYRESLAKAFLRTMPDLRAVWAGENESRHQTGYLTYRPNSGWEWRSQKQVDAGISEFIARYPIYRSVTTAIAVARMFTLGNAKPVDHSEVNGPPFDLLKWDTGEGGFYITDWRTLKKLPKNRIITRRFGAPMRLAFERGMVGGGWREDKLFTRLLNDWIDPEVWDLLAAVVGQALVGNPAQKIVFLSGAGRNGKTEFINLMSAVFGDYAAPISEQYLTVTKQPVHETGLRALDGRRLVTANEIPKMAVWNETLMKSISGQDLLPVRGMRQDYRDIRPHALMLLAGNDRPRLLGVDPAMMARLLIIPMDRPLKRPLDSTAMTEIRGRAAPAAAGWLIDGLNLWLSERELPSSDAVESTTAGYFTDQDDIGEIIRAVTTDNPGGWVRLVEVRKAAQAADLMPARWTARRFSDRLRAHPEFTIARKYGDRHLYLRDRRLTDDPKADGLF